MTDLAFPTVATDDAVTAAMWNRLNNYRVAYVASWDYNDAGSARSKDYSYTADLATTGVVVEASFYDPQSQANNKSVSRYFYVQVDGVTKETKSVRGGSSGITDSPTVDDRQMVPVTTYLTSDDMTLDENHTITVYGSVSNARVTSLVIYVK